MTQRRVNETSLTQGVDEQITYTVTTTPWGSTPTAVAVKAYDMLTDYLDVTATVLTGSASVIGDVITLPVLKSLTKDHIYRLEVKFTCAGNVFECYAEITGER